MLVEKKSLILPQPFVTEGGATLSSAPVAYEEYGNPKGPVILICHGGLSSNHCAGKYSEKDAVAGWWDGVIGAGKPFDTDRFRILSINALGGMYGTCSPMTIDPMTGCRYGPMFPAITMRDQVRFAAAFLDAMGVDRLWCMAGPSMGSMHTLCFAAMYPERIERAVSVATAARMTASGMAMHHLMMNAFKADPAFHAGWYTPGVPLGAAKIIAQIIKLYYLSEKLYKTLCADTVPHGPGAQLKRSANTNAFINTGLDASVACYDGNSFIATLTAINSHDLAEGFATLEEGVCRIKCPILLINIDSDHEFPPYAAEEIAGILNAVRPGQATTRVMTSMWGHIGCIREMEQLGACLREWLPSVS
ncbi:MAG: metX [Proteobacteria bacterium]|nr:metX [Pseudomonadota bacterium]